MRRTRMADSAAQVYPFPPLASGSAVGSSPTIFYAAASDAANVKTSMSAVSAALAAALPGPKFLAWEIAGPTDAGTFALPVDLTMIGGRVQPTTVTLGEVAFTRPPSAIEGLTLIATSDVLATFPKTPANQAAGVFVRDATLQATGDAAMFEVTGDDATATLEGDSALTAGGAPVFRSTNNDVVLTVRGGSVGAGTLDAPAGNVRIRVEGPDVVIAAEYLAVTTVAQGTAFQAEGDPITLGVLGEAGAVFVDTRYASPWMSTGTEWQLPQNALLYRPNSQALPNVVLNFADFVVYSSSIPGTKDVTFDLTFVNNVETWDAGVPSGLGPGAFNWLGVQSGGTLPTFTIANDTSLLLPRLITMTDLAFVMDDATTTPFMTIPDVPPNGAELLLVLRGGTTLTGSVGAPIVDVLAANVIRVEMHDRSSLPAGTGPTLDGDGNGQITIEVYDNASIEAGAVRVAGFASLSLRVKSPGAVIDPSYGATIILTPGVMFTAAGAPNVVGVSPLGAEGCLYQDSTTQTVYAFDGATWNVIAP